MSSTTPVPLISLFEQATSEELHEPDYGLNLEIADRLNQKRSFCVEGIEYFKQLLKNTDPNTIKMTMALLDTCVKNCNINFHRYICHRDLVPCLVNILKRKRKKLSFFDKLISLYKEPEFIEIEVKILGLIQLWADTFMMQEDKFPSFMKHYRELRKEGVQFPPRDPNERYMIKFEGEASPAFELADIEQQIPNLMSTTHQPSKSKSNPKSKPAPKAQEEHNEQEFRFTHEDAFNLKNYIPFIQEALLKAKSIKDLQDPNTKDIIRKTRRAQNKLIIIAASKAANNMAEEDTAELLSILDYVNEKIEAFKKAVQIIKSNRSQKELRSTLGVEDKMKEDPLDMFDLEDDFLSVPEKNPLDNIEKYVYGHHFEFKEVKPVKQIDEQTAKPVEQRKDEKIAKRLEFPDLLLEDFKDEETHCKHFNPHEDPKEDDPFDLGSIIFDADSKPSQPVSAFPQPSVVYSMPQQSVYPQQPVNSGVFSMPGHTYSPQYSSYPPQCISQVPQYQVPYGVSPSLNPLSDQSAKKEDLFGDLGL